MKNLVDASPHNRNRNAKAICSSDLCLMVFFFGGGGYAGASNQI